MRFLPAFLSLLFAVFANAAPPGRVVAIGGALTEIVYALEAEDSLVGTDTTSYYPPEANSLPKVGYQRTISAEGVLSLAPDVVLITEQAGPPAVLKQLKSAGIRLVKLRSGKSLDDVRENIRKIADLAGKNERGELLIESIGRQADELKKSAEGKSRKRIIFILNHGGGIMVAGRNTAADAIISLSGAENAVDGYEGYKPLTPEAAVALKPDVILVTKQGFDRVGGKKGLLALPGLSLTPAGQRGNVIVMDALLMLGFGPRTVMAAGEIQKKCGEF